MSRLIAFGHGGASKPPLRPAFRVRVQRECSPEELWVMDLRSKLAAHAKVIPTQRFVARDIVIAVVVRRTAARSKTLG